MAIRQTATTIECKLCGNTDPDKFSVVTGGYKPTRFAGRRAEEPGSIVLHGARCLVCAKLTAQDGLYNETMKDG